LTEAKKRLEQAQQQLTESLSRVTEIQRDITNMNLSVKRAYQELNKSDLHLKRKQDVVRRALKRKDEIYGVPINTFETGEDGSVRLNSAADRSSSMNDVGFESQDNMARIEKLRKEEASIESEFLMLVEKASRLVSRSERLRLRSEALLGIQKDDVVVGIDGKDQYVNNGGTVVGDNFGNINL
jgi:hypothetical protein